ncbi:hypothetical protein AGR7C_Lc140007 [Agrobacterium deltaense Zutra 3/1]|uniref:Uncharacterized protein n=1 Tax=Agrobacterium deltaense Zutra 3/1 TaxID=1183427 RepID=A0A1S7R876_9HYPH|nr:hypothetical protein AGR7C_Lc140007 [Agrobacterium deltaense Zutra 3/1]
MVQKPGAVQEPENSSLSWSRNLGRFNQAIMSARLNARKVMTLEASHALPLSKPLEVAAFIDEAAAEVAKSK